MAQTKVTKKSARRNRKSHSELPSDKSIPHCEEYPLDAQANDDTQASASHLLPARLNDVHNADVPAEAPGKSTALALVSQRIPAVYGEPQLVTVSAEQKAKRKFSTMVQSVLISVCLVAALIFLLGTLKPNRNGAQVAPADSVASLTVPAPAPDVQVEGKVSPPKKDKATAHPPRAHAESVATASKPNSSTPHAEKKLAQARTEHAARPAADTAKKKPASTTVAKAPKKAPADQPVPLLAQNSTILPSKSFDAQDRYAQCQEIGNFFRREQCKWQACNGKWGQDGCPAYSNSSKDIN